MQEPHYYTLVYDLVRLIPSGRVSTYGAIADALALGSARMVGWALKQCVAQGQADIPAHRVVNRLGELSGRLSFDTPTTMADRLRAEGILVLDNRIVHFQSIYWHPDELDL